MPQGPNPVSPQPAEVPPRSTLTRFLDAIEWVGNKLPDPAVLFVILLFLTWGLSAWLSLYHWEEIDPRTGKPIAVQNLLTGPALADFLVNLVKNFVEFPPLGVVLVALLGVGVAEHTGFINAAIRGLLSFTPAFLLTPMLLLVALLSHAAGDTGYVLVIPLGGVIFAAAGRHPLAGIAAAFAGVSGGFSACLIPTSLDPLLWGFTQPATHIIDPTRDVNALCNLYFTTASSALIIGFGWLITDRLIEPRLRGTPVDGDAADVPKLEPLTPAERTALLVSLAVTLVAAGLFAWACGPEDSPFRSPKDGRLDSAEAPLMKSLVQLIFLFFLLPGIVYGYLASTVKSHRDIVKGMSKSMSTMGYYLVLAFFAAQFTVAFRNSNLAQLLALKGAAALQEMGAGPRITIVGIILLSTFVNLFIGSASAKWAVLAPIFVPMLMRLGLSPELTQAAYRIGDSSTNIITPLMPYFPLIVVYCQRYVKNTGIGTLAALMIPYSITFLVTWTAFLLVYWELGLPLGVGETTGYTYP